MECFFDRRNDSYARIPLNKSLVVEFEGLTESIEVDCVDLSTGGASLRTTLLPEEGTTVFCSFESVSEGADFGAWGKVAWVSSEGKRGNEFGICFQNLDSEVETRISRLLTRQMTLTSNPLRLSSQPGTVKLMLDGAPAPIEAYLVDYDDERMTFAQDLDLLQLERGLLAFESPDKSCRGRIESIDLEIDKQVPKLFITMRKDPVVCEQAIPIADEPEIHHLSEACDLEPMPAASETLPSDESKPVLNVSQKPTASETLSETLPSDESKPFLNVSQTLCEAQESPCEPEISSDADTRKTTETATLFALPEDDVSHEAPTDLSRDYRGMAAAVLATVMKTLIAVSAVLLARSKLFLGRFAMSTGKSAGEKWEELISGSKGKIQQSVVPFIKTAFHRLPSLQLLKKKRRTTAAPPSLLNTKSKAKAGGFKNKDSRFRFVPSLVLPGLAVGGIVLAFYGFGSWSDDHRIPLHRPVAVERPTVRPAVPPVNTTSAQTAAVPPVTAVSKEAAIARDPGASSSATPLANATPIAAASSSQNAPRNPVAPPTTNAAMPRGVTNTPASIPAALAASAPVETPQIASSSTEPEKKKAEPVFGSQKTVAGRSFTLRMSKEITELNGTPEQDGFTVIIPGSLSYDRAGPLVAANPLVASSVILNKGDHSALTIRFAQGKSPAYRVAAKGATLEITIAESS
jgi:hypothetical protein